MGNSPSIISDGNISRKSFDISGLDSDESLHSQSGTNSTTTQVDDQDDQLHYVNSNYDNNESGEFGSSYSPGIYANSNTTNSNNDYANYLQMSDENSSNGSGNRNANGNANGHRNSKTEKGNNNSNNVTNNIKNSNTRRLSTKRFRRGKTLSLHNSGNSNNNNNNNNNNKSKNNINMIDEAKKKAIIISFKDVDVNGSHICTVELNNNDISILFLGSYDPLSWVLTGKKINLINKVIIRETLSTARLADDKIPQWYIDGIDNKKCDIIKDCNNGFYQQLTESPQSAKLLINELENTYNCQIVSIEGGYKAPLEPILL